MTVVQRPAKMPADFESAKHILDDNFDKIIQGAIDLAPRQFSTVSTGARPAANVALNVVGIYSDRPEYTTYAALTQKYDIYVDSGTNATGTLSITNNTGSTYTVTVGDYFTDDPTSATSRIWIATSAASILDGNSGSVSVVAEKCGYSYNVIGLSVFRGAANILYNYFDTTNLSDIYRYINITPTVVGGGGGGGATLSLTTSGGDGTILDSTKLWPNGSGLTSAQKAITIHESLSITTQLPTPASGDWSFSYTAPYSKAFAISTISITNRDSSPHSIYINISGNILSGTNGIIFA